MSAVGESPTQSHLLDWQRKAYKLLQQEIVPRELVEDGSTLPEEKREDWVNRRRQLIEGIIDCILDIANGMPDGVEDPGVTRMLTRAVELQRTARDDQPGTDPEWKVRRAAQDLSDTVLLMKRRLDRLRLDDPGHAASFVIETLKSVETQRIAALLGVSTKTISQWRGEKVATIKKSPERVALVGQLVRYLQSTWTPHGIVAWFEAPRDQLGKRSPLELLDKAEAWEQLREMARGSRSQLAD